MTGSNNRTNLARLFLISLCLGMTLDDEMFEQMTLSTEEAWPLELNQRRIRPRLTDDYRSEIHLKSPIVGQKKKEQLCFEDNTKDGVCTVANKKLRFEENFIYVTKHSLVFQDTKLYCLTKAKKPCDFGFELDGDNAVFEMNGESQVTGRQVLLEVKRGSVIFKDHAHFNVTGLSSNTNGSNTGYAGADFIGQGGTCKRKTKHQPYGSFNMVPKPHELLVFKSQMGSMGNQTRKATGGGGRIVIKADSIDFASTGIKLQADGLPLPGYNATHKEKLQGGSGGYIFIETFNTKGENKFHAEARVSAVGGSGVGQRGGGSGGVIVFEGGIEKVYDSSCAKCAKLQIDVDASGGTSDFKSKKADYDGCANGASGTVYFLKSDSLLLHNKNKLTNKHTVMETPFHKHRLVGDPYTIAKNIVISGRASGAIMGKHDTVAFDHLRVDANATLKLDRSKKRFRVELRKNVQLDADSTFDLSNVNAIILNSTEHSERITLGNVLFRNIFGIRGQEIHLNGRLGLPKNAPRRVLPKSTAMIKIDRMMILGAKANIRAGRILMQANGTIMSEPGFKMKSYIKNTCNTRPKTTLFTCVPEKTLVDEFNHETYLTAFNNQFVPKSKKKATRIDQVIRTVFHNYTVYIVSFQDLRLIGANISAPRIGICAPNITLAGSHMDVSEQGCPSHTGRGYGQLKGACSGAGGAHGGFGGHGGSKSTISANHDKCKVHYSHPYYYGTQARFEGSGGAAGYRGNAKGTKDGKVKGGNGGGILWLSSTGTIELNNTKLTADGGNGVTDHSNDKYRGSGGGAGGSIQLITKNLRGNGQVSIRGGDGSVGGGGGGSGGRMAVEFLRSFLASSYPDQSYYWTGDLSIDGGKGGFVQKRLRQAEEKEEEIDEEEELVIPQVAEDINMEVVDDDPTGTYLNGENGASGTAYHQKCFGGYTGPFCKACDVGTFKLSYSFGTCKPCENKPKNAFYTERGVDQSLCPYECSPGLDPYTVNPYCENAFNQQITRVGGASNSLLVILAFMLMLALIWVSLIVRSNTLLEKMGDGDSTAYDSVLFNSDAERDNTECEIGRRDLKMRDSDIWSHSHRMYLIGENSIYFPWYIPKDFPNKALEPEQKEKFLRFLKQKQVVLDWSVLEKQFYYILRVIFPPMADWIHKRARKNHFTALQDGLYETFGNDFWSEPASKTIRVATAADDGHLAYIDFLDKSKSKLDYLSPKLPMTLLMSGSGTFNSPYMLDFEDDAYAKALICFNKEELKPKLPLFFENLNTLLSKLSFFKLNRQAMKDLADVVDWVDVGNKTMFNPLNVKATLYLFENSYQEVDGGLFRQKRRSLPLDALVLDAFPDMYKNVVKFVQSKLLVKRSELRLGLVFTPHSGQKNQRLRDRIRKVIQQQRDMSQSMGNMDLSQTHTEQLFVSDDEEDQQVQVIRSSGGVRKNLGEINRHQQDDNQEGLLNEHTMEETEVFVHGSHSEFVKIIDKSRRAFSFSTDSTKAFQNSLKKPRDDCKNKCVRFRATAYAFWILLFKHHGIAPGKGGLFCYFFAFSFLVAMDIVLLMSMFLHILSPPQNLRSIGIPFLFIYPGIAVLAPFCGALGCILGSPALLRTQSSMNAACVLVNYPATLLVQLCVGDEPVYVCVVFAMILNKTALSFYGAKVRQHLINPTFVKNQQKFKDLVELQLTVGNRFPRSRILAATDEEEEEEQLPGSAAQGEDFEDHAAFASSIKNRSERNAQVDEDKSVEPSSSAF